MTTIAWDGQTLAADRAAGAHSATKIFRVGDSMYGFAGRAAGCMEALEWIKAGAIPADMPAFQRDENDGVHILRIDSSGRIWIYERGPYPSCVENVAHAIGSGSHFALGAMAAGARADEAVRIASEFDPHTGRGVDQLHFTEPDDVPF